LECKLDDITVYYQVFGTGRPILMLHGWSLDHRHMVSEMEPVFVQRDGWRRIYPDLPGHGQTLSRPWISDQDDMLGVVLNLIDELMPGERFVVAGMSAGAYLARGVLYHRAAMVDGLLLTVPVVVPDDAKRDRPAPVTLVGDATLTEQLEGDVKAAMQFAVVQSRSMREALQIHYCPPGREGDQEFRRRIRRDPNRYGFSMDIDALSRPFSAPTLILTGRQDSAVGYRDAWQILENYPRASFVVLDRAGHLLAVDQKGLFRALVGEWLDRVEEYTFLR
jgi:pimeloyl-ACP methyl ester carboxylesterase